MASAAPPCSGVLAARRRLHDRARLKLSRTGSRSTISGDHPRGPRRAGDKLILFIHRPTPCTPRGQCQRGHFRRLLQTGIAGSGLLWASQLDPQPAWPGPGRGGHCGGRGGSRDMKTGASERSRTSCSYHQPLCFLVFVFPRPPAASGPPGRPLTVESKTLRPGTTGSSHRVAAVVRRVS